MFEQDAYRRAAAEQLKPYINYAKLLLMWLLCAAFGAVIGALLS